MNYRTMKVEGHEVSDAVQRLVVPAFVEKIRAEGAQDFNGPLPPTPQDREHVRSVEGLAAHRHPL
jgi:hypothetical protein